MALIEINHPVTNEEQLQFWIDAKKNTEIVLFETQKAILVLARNEKESYTMNTGQSTITVRRVNLPELEKSLVTLRKEIQEIQNTIDLLQNPGGSFVQVVPL